MQDPALVPRCKSPRRCPGTRVPSFQLVLTASRGALPKVRRRSTSAAPVVDRPHPLRRPHHATSRLWAASFSGETGNPGGRGGARRSARCLAARARESLASRGRRGSIMCERRAHSEPAPFASYLRHALRTALLPLVALFSVELPTALGGALVVEKALGISGLAKNRARCVEPRHRLVGGRAFMTALLVTLTSVIADLAIAAIDPRLSSAALRHRRSAG